MINQERFDDTVFDLAREDGTDFVLMIPGVWESVSEYYNNAAIERIQDESADESENEQ